MLTPEIRGKSPLFKLNKTEKKKKVPFGKVNELFSLGRLGGYASGFAEKIRIGDFRILALGTNLDGCLYVDIYFASKDEKILKGVEILFSPSMEILKCFSYFGGFTGEGKVGISPKRIFDAVLKPCRKQFLSCGTARQEFSLEKETFRYCFKSVGKREVEIVEMKIGATWKTVHEVTFVPVKESRVNSGILSRQ